MKVNPNQPMRAQLGSTPFPVWGRSSSFYTFFQDCVRGQHLCLAQVERSSSHTKTSEFWSLLTLFLRQPPNYTQLCGRIFKKNPPTPFCPHPAPKSLYKGEPLLTFYVVPASSVVSPQVTLGISALLSMTVFLMTIRESLPPTEKTPLISKLFILYFLSPLYKDGCLIKTKVK